MSDFFPRITLARWKVSLTGAILGFVFVGLPLIFPSLARLPLPGDRSLSIPLLAATIPLAGAAWAIAGYREKIEDKAPRWLALSLVISVVTIGLAVYGYWTLPKEFGAVSGARADLSTMEDATGSRP